MRKSSVKHSVLFVFVSALLLFLPSCKIEPDDIKVNVSVTSITLEGKAEVDVGSTVKIVANVFPKNATNAVVTWKSSDESIATVKDGVVKGVKAGTVSITATADGKSVVKNITVKKPAGSDNENNSDIDNDNDNDIDNDNNNDNDDPAPENPKNLITEITSTDFFYAINEWNDDPSGTITGSLLEGYTLTMPAATSEQWKAQAKFVTDAVISSGREYDFSVDLLADANMSKVTAKLQVNGTGDEANNTYLFADSGTNLVANEIKTITISTTSSVNIENALLILDFGGNPAATVKITNFELKYKEMPEETPVEGNLISSILKVESPENHISYEGSIKTGYRLSIPTAYNYQWGNQLKLTTNVAIEANKGYSFSIDMKANNGIGGITVKLQNPNNDSQFVFTDSATSLAAGEKKTVTFTAVSKDSYSNAMIVLDYGWAPANTTVELSKIVIKEKKFELVIGDVELPEFPSVVPASVPETITVGGKTYKYVWSDEFTESESDGTPLASKWGYDVGRGVSANSDGTNPNNWSWGNGEEQWYTNKDADNTYVSDGTLKIKAIRENKEGATWTSGRIVTRNIPNAQFKYGYVEMKAKIPYDRGVWPAFWMLDNDIYAHDGIGAQEWPLSGEIDIMETSVNLWQDNVYGTLHCNAGHSGNPIITQRFTKDYTSFSDGEYHTYAVDWNEDHIDWYYDGVKQFTYNPANFSKDNWPFNEEFYIIINLAVGGNLGGAVPAELNESTMEIDYVRVYQNPDGYRTHSFN